MRLAWHAWTKKVYRHKFALHLGFYATALKISKTFLYVKQTFPQKFQENFTTRSGASSNIRAKLLPRRELKWFLHNFPIIRTRKHPVNKLRYSYTQSPWTCRIVLSFLLIFFFFRNPTNRILWKIYANDKLFFFSIHSCDNKCAGCHSSVSI